MNMMYNIWSSLPNNTQHPTLTKLSPQSMLKVTFTELCLNGNLVDCQGSILMLTLSQTGGWCMENF